MKATYRRDSAHNTRRITLGVVIIFFTLILLFDPTRSMFSRAAYSVAPWVWGIGGSAQSSWSTFWGEVQSKASLVSENKLLREEIDRMQVQVLDRNLLEERVIDLEGTLGRAGVDNRVSARVLVGAGRSPYDILVIDAGTDEGVSVGDQVAYAGSGVIGEISEVYSSSSKVKLYSSPGEEVRVLIGNVPAIASGRGLGNFTAKIPQGSLVVEGEQVLLEGSNFIIGKIGAIEEKPAEPYIRVYFRSPFNISGIRSVEVIKNKSILKL